MAELTLDLAQQCISKAIEIAKEMRLRVAVVVVDRGGHTIASARMDGVGYINLEVARLKANTARYAVCIITGQYNSQGFLKAA